MGDGARPVYETAYNRERQFEIAAEIGARWKCAMFELPRRYEIDFAAVREERLVAAVEVKERTHLFAEYPDVILSLGKWLALRRYEEMGVPGILAFRFRDGIYHMRVKDFQGPVLWGGRTSDTRDKEDIEPIIKIPAHCWKKLEGKP